MNRRSINLLAPMVMAVSVMPHGGPLPSLELANAGGGTQPHGHSSSQGSTSNMQPKAVKKCKNKLRAASRRRNR